MRRRVFALSLLVGLARIASAQAPEDGARVWEINGIRLEPAQVERLADDMAGRTVAAVEEKIPDIALRDGQAEQMRSVYRGVALDVFAEVVTEVARTDQTDAEKETRVRELVLAGQTRSHGALVSVLDERQLALYTTWEDRQVAAFKSRRWNDRRRRR
jgi:predicted alpha-1,6-mannanase (GH76 family)